MKKKRSIQKLSFQKETISTLNAITAGANITTTIVVGTHIVRSAAVKTCLDTGTVTTCDESCMRRVCEADSNEYCSEIC